MIETVGVILAGGTGSRLLPLTRAVNKHLLPVNGFPMLHWPLRTLCELGIRHAIVVLGGESCGQVVETFGTRYHARPELPLVEEGGIEIVYVYQEGAGGIPSAYACAGRAILDFGVDRVVIVLGDNVFPHGCDADLSKIPQDSAAVLVKTDLPDVRSYGCVALPVDDVPVLVEKPKDEAPDDHGGEWAALLGLYVLPRLSVYRVHGLEPSARNETEIVDLLRTYAHTGDLVLLPQRSGWIDAGDPEGYAQANDPEFWK